jgi:hypothetical protein
MRTVFAVCALLCALTINAEARHRRSTRYTLIAAFGFPASLPTLQLQNKSE